MEIFIIALILCMITAFYNILMMAVYSIQMIFGAVFNIIGNINITPTPNKIFKDGSIGINELPEIEINESKNKHKNIIEVDFKK